jgi:hypothetical protein
LSLVSKSTGDWKPSAVVKDFDPVKDRGARLGARGEVPPVNQFAF